MYTHSSLCRGFTPSIRKCSWIILYYCNDIQTPSETKPRVTLCALAGAFKFGIKRGGLLYGNTDEAGNVSVDFIYEPPQEGSPETLKLHRGGEEEAMVGFGKRLHATMEPDSRWRMVWI